MPDELRRGANGCMPACELADLLAKVMERWWRGDQAGARELHHRLLPLIIRENHPFMRYILKRRGSLLQLSNERRPTQMPSMPTTGARFRFSSKRLQTTSNITLLARNNETDSVDPIFMSAALPARQSDRHNHTVAPARAG